MRNDELKAMIDGVPKVVCEIGVPMLSEELDKLEKAVKSSISETILSITNIEKKVGKCITASIKGEGYTSELIEETLSLRDSIIGSICMWNLDMIPEKSVRLDLLQHIKEGIESEEDSEEDNV